MNISYKTEYALRALFELSQSDARVPICRQEIAKRQQIPKSFLAKILAKLEKAQIVRSFKGPGGGFLLNKTLNSLSFWDIYQIVEDQHSQPLSHDEHKICYHSLQEKCNLSQSCKVKYIWKNLYQHIQTTMQKVSLSILSPNQPKSLVTGRGLLNKEEVSR